MFFCIDHLAKFRPMDAYAGLLGQGWMLSHRDIDGHYAGYLADLRRVRRMPSGATT
jgi:hypothetical protein